MTIELSSHVLSFNKKLFLSVISLFIAFAICFMAFQYRREKEYKIEPAEHTTPELQRPPE